METKYDGEHFLLHRINAGETYKFFSRHGLEHTDDMTDNSLSKFARTLHSFFKETVKNCVLGTLIGFTFGQFLRKTFYMSNL